MTRFIVKLGLTAVFIALVVTQIDGLALLHRLMAMSAPTVGTVIVLSAVQILNLALRWRLLCQFMHYDMPFPEALTGTLICQFFNQGLPASVGGDASRVWFLTRRGMPISGAAHNVFLDRLAGLASLLVIGVPASLLLVEMVGPTPPVYAVITMFIALAAALFVLCSRYGRWLTVQTTVLMRRRGIGHPRGVPRKLAAWMRALHRLLAGARLSIGQTVLVLLIGAAVHGMVILICWLVALDVRVGLSLKGALAVIPGVLLFSYLPLSIGGWGVREGSMAVGLGLLGVATTDAIFIGLALGAITLVGALAGGVVWLAAPLPRKLPSQ